MLKLRHVVSTGAATVLGGGLALLLAFVAARLLTPTENGHYAQYLLVMSLVTVCLNMGLGPASTYLAAGHRSLAELLRLNFLFVGMLALIALLVGALLATTPAGGEIARAFNAPLPLLYFGLAAGVLLTGVNQIGSLLMGRHLYDRTNAINVLRAGLPLPFVAMAGFFWVGELAIAAAQTLGLAVALGIALTLLRGVDGGEPTGFGVRIKPLLRYGSVAYLANLLHFVAMRGLLFFVSFYSAPEQVGYFSLALLLLEAMLLLPTAIGQLLFPQASSSGFDRVLVERLLRVNLYVGLAAAALAICLAKPLVLILLGVAYVPVAAALANLAPAIVLMTLPRILSQLLSGRGHPGYPLAAAVISSALGSALAVWWIPSQGIVGAAWITNAVAAVTACVTLFGYCRIQGVTMAQVLLPQRDDFMVVQRAVRGV
jgi:O-antigen/teichoic acid export membrane protein